MLATVASCKTGLRGCVPYAPYRTRPQLKIKAFSVDIGSEDTQRYQMLSHI